ncbi:MAG: glycogen/starch synthase [Chitinophagales bacterium]|nr:glycogen/starch synthase [Chitinophagales bacterium]
MSKKKVLIVTQEMKPYLDLTDISGILSGLPTKLQDQQLEIRVLMPRFGVINERRHRLHEVVRLSGINVVVNDEDYPLIIKVASLPGARLLSLFFR